MKVLKIACIFLIRDNHYYLVDIFLFFLFQSGLQMRNNFNNFLEAMWKVSFHFEFWGNHYELHDFMYQNVN